MIDNQEVLDLAIKVIDEAFVGIMTTVDEHSAPISRLMGAVTDDEGPHRLFSLSAKDTRKVQHLEKNPAVYWLFGTPPYETSVTLRGVAKRSETPIVPQPTWDRLADWAKRPHRRLPLRLLRHRVEHPHPRTALPQARHQVAVRREARSVHR